MERRKFLGGCAAVSGAVGLSGLPAWASVPLGAYPRARLVDVHGAPVRARTLVAETNYLFHYPFAGTPCFLLNLGRGGRRAVDAAPRGWRDGTRGRAASGPLRAIVAFSAICAHKLAYPTRDVSFIRYQPQRSATSDALRHPLLRRPQRVRPRRRRPRAWAGPAPQPLAAILLDYDAAADELSAVGTAGTEQFDAFFTKYEFRLAVEHGAGEGETCRSARATVVNELGAILQADDPVLTSERTPPPRGASRSGVRARHFLSANSASSAASDSPADSASAAGAPPASSSRPNDTGAAACTIRDAALMAPCRKP